MNTGQLLVSLSGLPTGSAMTHLAAITTGSGTGTGETIFAHQMTVVASQRSTKLSSTPARNTATAPARERVVQKADGKYAYAFTPLATVSVFTSVETLFITEATRSESVSATVLTKETTAQFTQRAKRLN